MWWWIGCDAPEAGPGLEQNFGVAESLGTEGCDNLLPECLYPFPSDAYVGDAGLVLPVLLDGELDPEPTARNAAFGAASPMVFQLPGAVAPLPGPFDSAASLAEDARVVVVDAQTGERIPHWIEPDYLSPEMDPPLLVIRPAVPLPRGHDVVVGVRGLTDAAGAQVAAAEGFVPLRDRTASRWRGVHARRQRFEEVVFPTLAAAGVERGELQLAWSFPVQSTADATGPMLAIRDAVLAALPEGGPRYTVERIEVCDGVDDDPEVCHPSIRVVLDGTVESPSVVEPPDELGLRIVRWDDDGRPVVDGVERWPFRLQLPHAAFDGPAPVPVLQYGHGLLGSRGEADKDWLRSMAERHGFAILACDLQGMNEDASAVWANVLFRDGGRFPELQDLALQGVANELVDQRLVRTSLAADPDPRLRRADGALAWDPDTVWYYGNSQGGSVGTIVTAVSVDLTRGVLGVPGSSYPLLLHRSTDFTPFVATLALRYPAPDAVSEFLALLGTGWDRSDPLTFAPHLRGDPLPGTPDHEVLYHVAKDDQQVVNEASFLSARAAGAALMAPPVRSVTGLPELGYPAAPGAALVEFDFGVPTDPTPATPPDGDPAQPDSEDPHGWLREYLPAQDQLVEFLRTGQVIDVCGGEPCRTDGRP
ncbi:MAG: hypothetical protein ABMA64_27530 [Myxococcota bacterium]